MIIGSIFCQNIFCFRNRFIIIRSTVIKSRMSFYIYLIYILISPWLLITHAEAIPHALIFIYFLF